MWKQKWLLWQNFELHEVLFIVKLFYYIPYNILVTDKISFEQAQIFIWQNTIKNNAIYILD